MTFNFEFTFEEAVLILKLIDGGPHNQVRPIIDNMIGSITAQQDQAVANMQAQDQGAQVE